MADASISNLIQTMQDHHNQDERAGKKSQDAQLNALNSLQSSFPDEFANALVRAKLPYEAVKGEQSLKLQEIARGVGGIPLTFGERFGDFFTNFAGIMPNRAERKRANEADLAQTLMQADVKDIAEAVSFGTERANIMHEEQKKQWIMSGKNSKIMRALTLGMSENNKGGAAAEKAKEAARAQQKTLEYLKSTSENTGGLLTNFLESLKEKGKFGILALVTIVAAGIMAVVEFFRSIGQQIRWMKEFSGVKLGKILTPMANFFRNVVKGIKNIKWIKTTGTALSNFFAPMVNFFRGIINAIKNAKWVKAIVDLSSRISSVFFKLGNFFRPMKRFADVFVKGTKFAKALLSASTQASAIVKWAGTFGRFLGKVFLPITFIMSAWDLITGAIAGWEKEGKSEDSNVITQLLAAIGGGTAKLVKNLVGIPMKWIGLAIGWLAKKMGFDEAGKEIQDFATKIPEFLSKIIQAPFNYISDLIKFIVRMFENPKKTFEDILSSIPFGDKIASWIFGDEDNSATAKMEERQARIAELDKGIAKGTGSNSTIGGWNMVASEEEVAAAKAERLKLIREDEEFRAKFADELRAEKLAKAGGGRRDAEGSGVQINNVDAKKINKPITVSDKGLIDPAMAGYAAMKEVDYMSYGGGSSDIRLKEDIILEGKSPSGINIYSFKYKDKVRNVVKGIKDIKGRYKGVMAQEVPWASFMDNNGYLMVDYSKVDVEFIKL